MQNSMWKFATLLGVIGVGCLVIMQVQKGLTPKNGNDTALIKPTGQAVPPAQAHDPFADLAGGGNASFSADQFEPAADQFEPQAQQFEPAAQQFAATEEDPFGPAPAPAPPANYGAEAQGAIAQTAYQAPPAGQLAPAQNLGAYDLNTEFGADSFTADPAPLQPGTLQQPVTDAAGNFFGELQDTATQAATNLQTAAADVRQDATQAVTGAMGAAFDELPQFDAQPAAAPFAASADPFAAADDQFPTPDPAAAFGRDQERVAAPDYDADAYAPGQGQPGQFDDEATAEPVPFGQDRMAQPPQDLPQPSEVFRADPLEQRFEPNPTAPGNDRADLDAPAFPGFGDESDRQEPQFNDNQLDPTQPYEPRPLPMGNQFGNDMNSRTPDISEYSVQSQPVNVAPIPTQDYSQQTPGIRATSGSRYQKSIDSVPHGTLRPQLRIEKSAPPSASIGKPLVYSILIKNVGNAVANGIVVEDQIPRDAKLTGTKPQAELIDGILVWKFETLQPDEQRKIQIQVIPEREGQIGSVATVNFKAEIGSRTTVTAPRLRLELQGSQEAKVGETVEFRYRVINEGSGDATNVIIRNPLPRELQHPGGNELEYPVGDLPAGKSREVTLQLVAYAPGQVKNSAIVMADGVANQTADARISILGAQLQVTRRGPQRRYLNRKAIYENVVSNATHRDAENATLIEYVPDGMQFVQASEGGQYNEIKRTITWPIVSIRAGDSRKFTAVLMPVRAGRQESVVQIVEQAGFKSRTNSATDVVHLDNMGLQLSELDGPVQVNEKVVFTINVRNRGTSTATGSVLSLEVPPELKVGNAGPVEARQDGNIVVFAPVDAIPAGGQKRFQVEFTAKRAASNVRLRASIRSDQMPKSLMTEESITIFEDENTRRR